jgi:AcrR family transcriptional regulator
VFARQGYHGTGLSELLSIIGLHKGGFYHHMSSKEQLLLEIMLDPIEQVLVSSRPIVESADRPAVKLEALGLDLGRAITENLASWTVFLREYSALGRDAQAQVLALRRAYLDQWRAVLTEGMAGGDFREVDLSFIESVFGLFIYTFIWNGDGASAEAMTASIMDVLTHGVCASPELGCASAFADRAHQR